jgi:7,8-dihydroneopterin aldolase/epimerase/oxygenase
LTPTRPVSLASASPTFAGDGQLGMDVIFIEGFTGETIIGIHDSELHRTQPIVIDLHAGVPRAQACSTDRIGDTIDYSVVAERLRRLMREHRLQLLEAFAETVADILLNEFGAHWVRVKVVKPKKFADVDAVGVLIERTAQAPADAPTHGAAAHRRWHGAGRPLKRPSAPRHVRTTALDSSCIDGAAKRPTGRPVGLLVEPVTQLSSERRGAATNPSWTPLRRRSASPTRRA